MRQDPMVTPEAVALEFETANVGSRIAAAALDWVIVTVGLYILIVVFAIGAGAASAASLGVPDWAVIALIILVAVLGPFGYFILQETMWRGRTVGKAALGLRVVTSEGGQIRFRHAFIRGIFLLVDGALTSGFAGLIAILTSKRNQRLGDMVAGTIVLRERTAMRSPTAVTFHPPRGLEHYTNMLDTTRLGAREYQATRSFLVRAHTLSPAARYNLAVQLANPIRELVRPLPPDGIQPEHFLAAVAAAHQRRQRAASPQGQGYPSQGYPQGYPSQGYPQPVPPTSPAGHDAPAHAGGDVATGVPAGRRDQPSGTTGERAPWAAPPSAPPPGAPVPPGAGDDQDRPGFAPPT